MCDLCIGGALPHHHAPGSKSILYMASPVNIMHAVIIVECVTTSHDLDRAVDAVYALNAAALQNESIAANISRTPARRGINTASYKIYDV